MPIDPIAAGAGASMYATTPTRTPKQTMDGEMFMSLLVAQLQNQDPSSPMDTNQMISQTTQLAMMEKLNTVADTTGESFSLQMRSVAAALIGTEVSYTDEDGEEATGTATGVSFTGPVPQVTVNDVKVSLDAISAVTTKPTP